MGDRTDIITVYKKTHGEHEQQSKYPRKTKFFPNVVTVSDHFQIFFSLTSEKNKLFFLITTEIDSSRSFNALFTHL